MRILSFLAVALLFTNCIAPKKVDELRLSYDNYIAKLELQDSLQQDSIYNYILALERAKGGNEMLLLTQDKMQNRLAVYEDELDELKGNFSSTSSRMSTELAQLKADKRKTELVYDTLLIDQRNLIRGFQESILDAENLIAEAFDAVIPTDQFRLTQKTGELILSVQEDALFQPRSVSQLTDKASFVLRAVMDALQADPLLKLVIVGHTDNQPNPRRGTDNWQYAALRATALADELAKTYYLSPNRFIAASHGAFEPLTSNESSEGQKINRRVDFVLRNNVGNLIRELGQLEK
jgi:flagellar motor protein MotB